MFSKFLKFATGATMIALLGLNNANATGLTPGMTFGVGAEWMFGIKTNRDLSYTATNAHGLTQGEIYSLDMKRDNGYGGSVSVGYLMDSGFEGGLEVLYKELKYKDAVSKSTLETTNLIGLLKGTYYIDLGSMIYPYITAGVGISHISAKGTIVNADQTTAAAAGAPQFVKFTDMKANKLAGEVGVGIAAAVQSALFSVGVKASTNQNMEDSKSYTDMKVVNGNGAAFNNSSDFAFGKLSQMNYEVEAKLKVIMS